jgi:hypothetical protein
LTRNDAAEVQGLGTHHEHRDARMVTATPTEINPAIGKPDAIPDVHRQRLDALKARAVYVPFPVLVGELIDEILAAFDVAEEANARASHLQEEAVALRDAHGELEARVVQESQFVERQLSDGRGGQS